MVTVAELLKDPTIPKDYFAPDAYVQGDFEVGLIENRQGARLIAIPDTLRQGIYDSLGTELGQAAGIVLFHCGCWWGKNFYRRFAQEVSEYYGKPIAQMEMIELLQCLKQCWKTHGWGTIDVILDDYQQGFLTIEIRNSAFSDAHFTDETKQPSCFAEAGLLSAFFSQLSGQALHCVQTVAFDIGKDHGNYFVLGLEERLQHVEAWREEEQSHADIMARLVRQELP